MARRGSRSRGQKVIDNVRWLSFVGGSTSLAAGTVAVQILSATDSRDTIMRTRGDLVAGFSATKAPNVAVRVGVGMWVVPEGTGTTVLGSPLSDPDADWFYYSAFTLLYEEMVTDVIACQAALGYREVIDSKAMRRPGSDTEVQLVIENVTVGSAGAIFAFAAGRILLGN